MKKELSLKTFCSNGELPNRESASVTPTLTALPGEMLPSVSCAVSQRPLAL